ncbi:hypothetical protein J4Q44_G00338780 [Coregonus suidteri]|uniref:Uncharacterized protein n=1 Tax=Coregonus suidteri TaxID=861788 RepID=A0AAN8Q9A6_9TELE
MHGESGRSSAFLCPFQVPLAQWCHVNMELRGRTSEVVVPDHIRSLNLTGWLQSCQEFQLELHVKLTGYLPRAREKQESELYGCLS